jgi:uncharacterized repeat protein (TIGR01451 family)
MSDSAGLHIRKIAVVVAAVIISAWIVLTPGTGAVASTPAQSPLLKLATFASPVRGVEAGKSITYTLVVSNIGTLIASPLFISSTLPNHTAFVATSGDFASFTFVSPLLPGRPMGWSIDSLAPQGLETKTITLVVTVKPETSTRTRIWLESVARAEGSPNAASSITHVVNQNTAPVTPERGGQLAGGNIVLDFPPASVTGAVEITYTSFTTPTTNARTMSAVGRTFTLEAQDATGRPVTRFARAYTLSLRYTDAEVAAAHLQESQLNLFFFSGGAWIPILPCDGCSIDMLNNTITVVLDHFTEFALGRSFTVYLPAIRR